MSVPPAAPLEADQVRVFFGFWPPEAERASLAAAGAALSLTGSARLVPRDSLHMTIAFIGAVPVAALGRVRRIGRDLRASACTIEFDEYEYWTKPEVVVAAARSIPPELQALWDDLHRDLVAEGFELRVKRLRPHVTLMRHVRLGPQLPVLRPFAFRARDLSLIRSETGGTQSVYTVLDTWPLLDEMDRR
jgi:2'-5' RNA ligase